MKKNASSAAMDESRETSPLVALSTGRTNFMGLNLEASAQALVPRRETELLGNTALKLLQELVYERGGAQVLDLGTGSGNLALALAHYETRAVVCATDISDDALELARRNARRHELDSRVDFFAGDLFAALPEEVFQRQFDLIVCNPPYISSSKLDHSELIQHEPRAAFDGGPFGLNVLGRLIQEAPGHLKPNSWLCFELGHGQGKYLANCLEKNKAYAEVRTLLNEDGEVRALTAKTCAPPIPTAEL
jgi:release factor glutamine methyltransferase